MRGNGQAAVLALVCGIVLLLTGCMSPFVTPESTLPATTQSPVGNPSSGGAASGSQGPASSLPEISETGDLGGNEPTVMPTSASVTVFYIAQGDSGTAGSTLGCGDSVVAVTSATVTFTDPVEGALRTLLANHSAQLGQSGLSNALWQSALKVDSVDRSGSNITAQLSGTLTLAGECDIPRVEQQLLRTAQQAAGAPVAITVNGKTLSDALSLK
ncbi:GerMN domain-containing protein [Arthrobacter sp. HLT1-20]